MHPKFHYFLNLNLNHHFHRHIHIHHHLHYFLLNFLIHSVPIPIPIPITNLILQVFLHIHFQILDILLHLPLFHHFLLKIHFLQVDLIIVPHPKYPSHFGVILPILIVLLISHANFQFPPLIFLLIPPTLIPIFLDQALEVQQQSLISSIIFLLLLIPPYF